MASLGLELPAWVTSGTSAAWLLLILAFIALVKAWPALTKLRNDAVSGFRDTLINRVSKLEADLEAERASCEARIAQLTREFHDQVAGLQRQLVAFQVAVARAAPLGEDLIAEILRSSITLVPHDMAEMLHRIPEPKEPR